MCDDIDSNNDNPIGVGEIYLTDSGFIYCWVNFTDVVGPVAIKFEWVQPEEDIYKSSFVYTPSGSFPLLPAYDLINVGGGRAASNPGKWNVKVYMEDVYVAETDFILVDYKSITENVD
ncbi:MAG: hypothetical protein ACW98F_14910 [Candidatus Hodarchaeales archaeon]|jgi:hypothetical protein